MAFESLAGDGIDVVGLREPILFNVSVGTAGVDPLVSNKTCTPLVCVSAQRISPGSRVGSRRLPVVEQRNSGVGHDRLQWDIRRVVGYADVPLQPPYRFRSVC